MLAFILLMVECYVPTRVGDYRTETNAGNENVGYQGCNLKLACISNQWMRFYGKLRDVKFVYVKIFIWFG
jgi:hypothetical protein